MQCPPTSVEFVVNVAERQVNDHNVTSSLRRKKPHPGNEAMPDTGANVGCADPDTTQEFEVTDRSVNLTGIKNHTVNDLCTSVLYTFTGYPSATRALSLSIYLNRHE